VVIVVVMLLAVAGGNLRAIQNHVQAKVFSAGIARTLAILSGVVPN